MYENLGLSFSAADYSLSFSHDGQPVWSYTNQAMDKQGALLIPVPDGSCLDGDKGRAINRDWIKLGWNALCAMRWPREHFAQNTKNSMASLTVAQYLEAEGYSKEFSDLVLLPFLASLMTCSLDAAQAYPANTVMHFIGKVVFGSRLLKARNGVSAVCKALTENLPTQHMSCVVNKIEIQADHKIRVHYRNTNNGSKDCSAEFDSLVLATPADIAADIISHLSVASGMQGPSKTLLEALKSVPYEDAQVSTHTDSSVMPKDPKNWRGVNLSTHTGQTRATATHWINQVEKTATTGRQLPHQLFQTVDPPHPLRKDSIISSTSFHRSLVFSYWITVSCGFGRRYASW
ncbi:hypothetical protein GGI07_000042 [Coemansia sp. Benny D115]|nr:hypothetical protein GGI07_000042 [Coemansia sp. Benny D115]